MFVREAGGGGQGTLLPRGGSNARATHNKIYFSHFSNISRKTREDYQLRDDGTVKVFSLVVSIFIVASRMMK